MRARFRSFGRRIFDLYNSHPITMNSIAGATVYCGGELICQVHASEKGLQGVDVEKIGEITALGAIENGILMHLWYNALSRWVGPGGSTPIVLIKCTLDQIFFATQQDGLFIALCALQRSHQLPAAIADVKKNFTTTWLTDCAVWPLVNFIGFAWVPMVLQPTYMSTLQFFWQIYMSASQSNEQPAPELEKGDLKGDSSIDSLNDEAILEAEFLLLDTDQNGSLDSTELKAAFEQRGTPISNEDLKMMIEDAHKLSGNATSTKVSLAEFKLLARYAQQGGTVVGGDVAGGTGVAPENNSTIKIKSAKLWSKVRETTYKKIELQKGGKKVFKRLDAMGDNKAAGVGLAKKRSDPAPEFLLDRDGSPMVSITDASNDDSGSSSSGVSSTLDKVLEALKRDDPSLASDKEWLAARETAKWQAAGSGVALAVFAAVRLLVFKR